MAGLMKWLPVASLPSLAVLASGVVDRKREPKEPITPDLTIEVVG
jgi:hypothetical protein